MTSPIQRTSQTDKTLMPLRGEGNQPPKPQRIINLQFTGNGLMSKEDVKFFIEEIKQRAINMEEETKMQIALWKHEWNLI